MMVRTRRPRRTRLSCLSLVFLAACSGGDFSGPLTSMSGSRQAPKPGAVASVAVSPASSLTAVGSALSLVATAYDAQGVAVPGARVDWTSSSPSVAAVDSAGRVTPLTPGSAVISAAVNGRTGSAEVMIGPELAAGVSVAPVSAALVQGDTLRFAANAVGVGGNPLAGRPTIWRSTAPEVASVDATGLVTALAVGSATISAVVDGRTAVGSVMVAPAPAASVTVNPAATSAAAGSSVQLAAAVYGAAGQVLARPVSWSSDAPAVATVDAAGKVRALSPGSAIVTAAADGLSGSAVVTVTPEPVASVTVSPASLALQVGASAALTARALGAGGNALAGRSVSWKSGAPAVADVDAAGVVTALTAGSAVVTATVEGRAASVPVTVSSAPPPPPPSTPAVARVGLTPASSTVVAGGSVTLTAAAYDASGGVLSGVAFTWSSADPAVATVSGGTVTAVGPGTTTIRASSAGFTAAASVTVTPQLAASVTVSPASVSLQVGGSAQVSATPRSASGTALTGRTVAWSSSAPAVAGVSPAGLVTALASGSATVTATVDGRTASSQVTVTTLPPPPAPAVARISLTPTSASIQVAGTVTFAATAQDAAGHAVSASFTWATGNASIATITQGGVVTAVAPGATTVTATSGGITATAAITVTAPPPPPPATAATVTVTPASASLQIGGTQQLGATARDASGAVLSGRTVTWASSAPAIATVSTSGLVTAVAAGSATITATADGKNGSAAISVAAPAPPPPPPPPPAPTVGTVFVDGFESGYAAKQNNAGWSTTTGTNIAIATDVAHSGTHSMRFTFPGKVDCLDASAEQRFTLGRNMQEVWLEYYIYYPAGGEGGSASYYHRSQYNVGCSGGASTDNNKFLAVFGPKYGGETTSIICTWTTTKALSVPPAYPGDSRIQSSYSKAGMGGVMPNIANYDPFIRGAGDRGRWMQIRAHFRVADFGQSNGEVQMWKDGVLVLSNTGLSWYDSTNQANYMTQGYLQGWANSGYAQTTNIYIDDFRIIDQNPGW